MFAFRVSLKFIKPAVCNLGDSPRIDVRSAAKKATATGPQNPANVSRTLGVQARPE
jgi:hypothetical protein